jgi:hypothetical protein
LFNSSADPTASYVPLLIAPRDSRTIFPDDVPATVPHGLGLEMAVSIPGLWYCTHLPNIFPQLTGMSFDYLKAGQSLSFQHQFF